MKGYIRHNSYCTKLGLFDVLLISALATNNVSRLYLIPSLMKNIIEVMNQTKELLPKLLQWESTGEALTFHTAEVFFQTFPNKQVSIIESISGF